ncbi:MAG: hypothetical protein QM784_05690 [Polyangiaceae bacterium]
MKRPRGFPTALLCLALNVACGSDDSSGGHESACVPGHSIACTGDKGCSGVQSCDDSGERYGSCSCGTDGVPSGTGGATSGGRSSWISATVAQGGGNYSGTKSTLPESYGGTTSSGTSSSVGGTSGTDSSASCTPKSMAGYSYPAYHSARRVASACTDGELETYFVDCYSSGNCTAFRAGGASASCGDCLLPTSLESPSYGPLLKLGTDSAYLSSTNLAGCIELVGEPACAAKIRDRAALRVSRLRALRTHGFGQLSRADCLHDGRAKWRLRAGTNRSGLHPILRARRRMLELCGEDAVHDRRQGLLSVSEAIP